jgi:hypothetical protein
LSGCGLPKRQTAAAANCGGGFDSEDGACYGVCAWDAWIGGWSLADEEPQTMTEISVDKTNLYREEIVTDLRVASIRKLVPIKIDGSPDESREPIFTGQTTLMSAAGPLPVQCPLDATTLEAAIDKFPEAVKEAVERLVEEAREMQRREASRIVVPGEVPIPGGIKGPGGGGIIG